MLSFLAKAAFAGLMVALIATVPRRYPGWGGLMASLPLVSVLATILLYAAMNWLAPRVGIVL